MSGIDMSWIGMSGIGMSGIDMSAIEFKILWLIAKVRSQQQDDQARDHCQIWWMWKLVQWNLWLMAQPIGADGTGWFDGKKALNQYDFTPAWIMGLIGWRCWLYRLHNFGLWKCFLGKSESFNPLNLSFWSLFIFHAWFTLVAISATSAWPPYFSSSSSSI